MRPAASPADPVSATAPQTLTDADFTAIARRAYQDFGLHLPSSKKDLVYSRLAKRLRHLGLRDFRAYCSLIESPGGAEERMQMLSALTTNVTHFFREDHHFRLLRETVLPPLLAAARAGGRVRIWSAGCSAGQEPYSLAFTVLDLCPDAARLDIRILASDVDPAILQRAQDGLYPAEELKAIPAGMRERFLDQDSATPTFRINERARAIVRFAELNLMSDWPMRGPFDIIFCRNVAIYFDKQTQARLWQRYAALTPPGGYLFLGHSERLSGPAEAMYRSAGVTAYCRPREDRDGPETAQGKGATA
jgi:chemotaxis protein methyltransferase CheR